MSWAILILAVVPAASPSSSPEWYSPSTVQVRAVDVGDMIRLQRGPGLGGGGEFVMFNTRLERISHVAATGGETNSPATASGESVVVPVSMTSFDGTSDPTILRKRGTSLCDTFSVESDEPLDFGKDYTIARISRSALRGGRGGVVPEGGDPIDPRTAYLFEKFFFGHLPNYRYDKYEVSSPASTAPTGDRNGDADQLQRAIWFLENEIAAVDPATGKSLGYEYDPTDLKIAEKTLGANSPAFRWIAEADAAVRDKQPDKIIGSRVRVLSLVHKGPSGLEDVQDVLIVLLPELGEMPFASTNDPLGMSAFGARPFGGLGAFGGGGGGGGYGGGGGGDYHTPTPTPTPPPKPVPEPGSLLIWGLALAGGATWAYRRRRRALKAAA